MGWGSPPGGEGGWQSPLLPARPQPHNTARLEVAPALARAEGALPAWHGPARLGSAWHSSAWPAPLPRRGKARRDGGEDKP